MDRTRSPVATDELLADSDVWLRRLAGRLVRDEYEVDDLVHEAWVAVLGKRSGSIRNLPSWLAAVVHNLSRRRLRHAGRHVELDAQSALALEDREPGPDEHMDLQFARERVVAAVLELAEPFRTTVLEAYFEGLPPIEIARRHGIPAATVRTRLNRALHRLRGSLGVSSDRRAPIWGALCLLAGEPRPAPTSLAPPGATAGLGLAASVAALFVVAAALALAPRTSPRGAAAPGSDGERAAVAEEHGIEAASSTDPASSAALERAALERAQQNAARDQGNGCGELELPGDLLVAPWSGDGSAIPQPAHGDSGSRPENAGAGKMHVARGADALRTSVELASTAPRPKNRLHGMASFVAPPAASTPAPAAAPSHGVAFIAPRDRGASAVLGSQWKAKPADDEEDGDDEDEDDGADHPPGNELNQGTVGNPGGGPSGAGSPFGIEKHHLLQVEDCSCFERIADERRLALQALIDSGRIDPRNWPNPCALCDAEVKGEVLGVVDGIAALIAVRSLDEAGLEGSVSVPLPFEELLLVPAATVRAIEPGAKR